MTKWQNSLMGGSDAVPFQIHWYSLKNSNFGDPISIPGTRTADQKNAVCLDIFSRLLRWIDCCMCLNSQLVGVSVAPALEHAELRLTVGWVNAVPMGSVCFVFHVWMRLGVRRGSVVLRGRYPLARCALMTVTQESVRIIWIVHHASVGMGNVFL